MITEGGIFYVGKLDKATTAGGWWTESTSGRSTYEIICIADEDQGLPVLVLFEGWGTAGKGSVLGKVIKNIDPRFFKVATMDAPTEEERRKPFLYRYFVKIPEKGKFEFLDSGWMDEIVNDCLHGKMGEKEYRIAVYDLMMSNSPGHKSIYIFDKYGEKVAWDIKSFEELDNMLRSSFQ